MRNKILYNLTGLFILACFLSAANAEKVSGLYSAIVPVQSQKSTDRIEGIQAAFKQVLIKLSGDSAVLDNKKIKQAIHNAPRFMEEYNYIKEAHGLNPLLLRVRFQSRALRTYLREQFAVWGEHRPLVLVWMAVRIDGATNLLYNETDNELSEALKSAAKARAIPLLLPVLDMNSMTALRADDVWSLRLSAIKQASIPYAAGSVLIMRVAQTNSDNWHGSARLVLKDGKIQELQDDGDSAQAIVSKIVGEATDLIAREYTQKIHEATVSEVLLEVNNITDVTAYGQLLQHLKRDTNVKDVQVLNVKPSTVVLNVKVVGGHDQLKRDLSLDPALRLLPTTQLVTADNLQSYRWNR